ncbi:hypothetical protein, unlikely [Trypanosoma brucei brucei TREU927]|uniref:Uncharacterized protein n=1 Tax=Trypanosoma brucei brucei (strain 927/4 GUTat10.1) TaxID=185431 RepID=Q385H5_TRYB2|nr:hypothetical protein, unlikely [Trypanosoma brucei brucei TREU927]EAN79556.1 hypothetical protein, unlikely [Trypanosoma brucei brucei TREU927]
MARGKTVFWPWEAAAVLPDQGAKIFRNLTWDEEVYGTIDDERKMPRRSLRHCDLRIENANKSSSEGIHFAAFFVKTGHARTAKILVFLRSGPTGVPIRLLSFFTDAHTLRKSLVVLSPTWTDEERP